MEPRETELEVWENTNNEWIVSLDDVVITKCHFELTARQFALKIKKLNSDNSEVKFVEIG